MQSLRDLLLKEKPDTISYIFEAYELLRSLSLVVRLLDYKQIKPKTKTAWSIDAIRSILTDPLYCDFPSLFEPSIKEAHIRCQKILAEQTAGNTQTHMRSYCHVFSGLLFNSRIGPDVIEMLQGSESDDFVYLLSPEEGIQKLNDSFFHEKSFDYWSLMDGVNPWILKEFLQQFVTKIYVDRGIVSSVTFKNDLTLRFIISNPVKNFTDFFKLRLIKKTATVSYRTQLPFFDNYFLNLEVV